MKPHCQAKKRSIAMICAILILAYAVMLLLPHTHQCTGTHCDICALRGSSRQLLLGLSWVTIACLAANVMSMRGRAADPLMVKRDGTPVGLKVKLSD